MGIDGLDTRALTLHLRNSGAMRVFISTEDPDPLSCVEKARQVPSMIGLDLASVVSTRLPYRWMNNEILPIDRSGNGPDLKNLEASGPAAQRGRI